MLCTLEQILLSTDRSLGLIFICSISIVISLFVHVICICSIGSLLFVVLVDNSVDTLQV